MGIESKKEGVYITDSLCCTAETNSIAKNDITIKIYNYNTMNQDI